MKVPDQLRQKLASGIREGEFGPAVTAFERRLGAARTRARVTLEREAPRSTLRSGRGSIEKPRGSIEAEPVPLRLRLALAVVHPDSGALRVLELGSPGALDPPRAPPTIVAPPPPVVAASPTSEPRPGEPWARRQERSPIGSASASSVSSTRPSSATTARASSSSGRSTGPLSRSLKKPRNSSPLAETKRRAAHARMPGARHHSLNKP